MAGPITVPAPNALAETSVTNDMIRHFIWDRTIEDNPLEMDLAFSDTEIGYARKFCAMMFNSIPPFTVQIRADVIPPNWEYPFMVGTIYHLFLGKLMSLQRKDLDYTAGNMTVDINKRRIDYLTKWSQFFKTEAEAKIKEQKVIANLNAAYGTVC